MKKAYVKPSMESEAFVPNEYITACHNDVSYVGKCDITGYVFNDTNGNGVYDAGIDEYDYKNTACDERYESSVQPHVNAFVFSERRWVDGGRLERGHYEGVGTSTGVFHYQSYDWWSTDNHVTANIDTRVHQNVSM